MQGQIYFGKTKSILGNLVPLIVIFMSPVLIKNVHVINVPKAKYLIVHLPTGHRYEDICDKSLLMGG